MKRLWGLVAGAALILVTGCTGFGDTALTGTCNATGTDASITAEQNATATAIVNVALGLGLGQRGAEIGVVVSFTESGLVPVNYGDTMASGQMSSSRGPFQQLVGWGPLADRLDPTKSATMFYTGGAAGQKGLMDVPGWQQMTIPQAAQTVQQSEFTDGSNFAKNLDLGVRVTASIIGGSAAPACAPGGPVAVITDGVNVTIPNNEFVAAAVRGKTVIAPNAGMAKGIAAGLGQLGLPYVWGGGGDGQPANNGCSRGGGALNSCGSEIGFDCSGLTAFVLVQGGFPSPGGESSSQRTGGTAIGWEQGIAGDIIGFPGHVAIFLGKIEGVEYILEASQVGTPIHVVKLTRSDHDASMHRYWSNAVS